MKKIFSITLTAMLFSLVNNAQGTFTKIHAIFQQSCVTGCHTGGSPSGQLDLTGTETDVYNRLIGKDPVNPSAKNKGYKLVDPGKTHNSFLLKKVNNGLDSDNDFQAPQEGVLMPKNQPALTNAQIDLIQSWILAGAPKTGTVADEQLIIDFHAGKGLQTLSKPAPPLPGEGFQVHFGSIFLKPSEEVEYFMKDPMAFTDAVEVTRLHTYMNNQSHHFLLYKFNTPSDANAVSYGLRKVTGFANAFTDNTSLVAAWQGTNDIQLPEGTGYFWEKDVVLDYDLHIRNYSPDSILKADVYLNIYNKPQQPQTVEMKADLIFYKAPPAPYPFSDFYIPNDGKDYKFTDGVYKANSNDTWYVWMLSSHTHKFGKDYDIYERNPNGTKGTQLYEGFYDFNYTFNQGYYDWEHPAVRYFEPQIPILEKNGLIHEAVYNNDSNTAVTFGIKTSDEMMLMFIQYSKQPPIPQSNNEKTFVNSGLKTYPNPTNGLLYMQFDLDNSSEVSLAIYDLTGKEVMSIPTQNYPAGRNNITISTKTAGLSPGMYFVRANTGEQQLTDKVIIE